jgi:hypothetical protein
MDSPLFYELQDHCHDVNVVTKTQQPRRSVSNNLHLNLNTQSSNNSIADLTSARGLAPIRVPPSGAVFGNAPQQQQIGEASYPELADINTPEISLDLQVYTVQDIFSSFQQFLYFYVYFLFFLVFNFN